MYRIVSYQSSEQHIAQNAPLCSTVDYLTLTLRIHKGNYFKFLVEHARVENGVMHVKCLL